MLCVIGIIKSQIQPQRHLNKCLQSRLFLWANLRRFDIQRPRFQTLILSSTHENRWIANCGTWFVTALNVTEKLYPVPFNFSYSAFCFYSIGFLKLWIHVSWKTKLTVWQTPSWPDTIQILPYAWNCFLVIKMAHAMTKAQGWGQR